MDEDELINKWGGVESKLDLLERGGTGTGHIFESFKKLVIDPPIGYGDWLRWEGSTYCFWEPCRGA